MIVTKHWLNEWVNLSSYNSEDLNKTFNSIGLEVDRVIDYVVPQKIVVGYVLECEKHPDADKLNVCQVDIGTAKRQVVCGAKNVAKGMHVAVAIVGAIMPSGLEIKSATLRGVNSEGMICSADELGLPTLNDGILVLDESIGRLELGRELNEYSALNDTLIELELTANRGDCLSIHGVARDLSAAYNLPLHETEEIHEEQNRIGIGRILQLSYHGESEANVMYRVLKKTELELPLLIRLRLSLVEQTYKDSMDAMLQYTTHATGVIFRTYSHNFFELQNDKARVYVKLNKDGFAEVSGESVASIVGVSQNDDSYPKEDDETLIVEASYVPPERISKLVSEHKVKSDDVYYRSSRGSEPELSFGMHYCHNLFKAYTAVSFMAGTSEYIKSRDENYLSLSLNNIVDLIGFEIDKIRIVQILKRLGFDIMKSHDKNIVVLVPQFRHDISNEQDIVEEVVRMVGIDNIPSRPLSVIENNQTNESLIEYKKRRTLRERSVGGGFYETVHYVFGQKSIFESYGFETVDSGSELLNPIVETLDTLRSTMLVGLLDAAEKNVKFAQKQVALFELGTVFDKNRVESNKMAFIFSGAVQEEGVSNHGKPSDIDFASFVRRVSSVIGDFELEQLTELNNSFMHPYQCAKVIIDGNYVGELYKLHPQIATEKDLGSTYLCEIDFSAIKVGIKVASAYSRFQASFRDLSLVIPSSLRYEDIKKVINLNTTAEIQRFYPVDIYSDEKMGESSSLTIRFVLQSPDKTLEEEDILQAMNSVQTALNSDLGIELR